MTQSHDEFLWRRAAELLEIERLIKGKPQRVPANYDRAERSCPLFADLGAHGMRALGVALPAAQVEAETRLPAAILGNTIEREAPFINLILPNGARFSAAPSPVSDGPTFSNRLHWRPVRPLDDFIAAPWQRRVIDRAIRQRFNTLTIGATGAGTSTLFDAVIAHVLKTSPDERLDITEDEPELPTNAERSILTSCLTAQPCMRRTHVSATVRACDPNWVWRRPCHASQRSLRTRGGVGLSAAKVTPPSSRMRRRFAIGVVGQEKSPGRLRKSSRLRSEDSYAPPTPRLQSIFPSHPKPECGCEGKISTSPEIQERRGKMALGIHAQAMCPWPLACGR
jgi:hypothetical protein